MTALCQWPCLRQQEFVSLNGHYWWCWLWLWFKWYIMTCYIDWVLIINDSDPIGYKSQPASREVDLSGISYAISRVSCQGCHQYMLGFVVHLFYCSYVINTLVESYHLFIHKNIERHTAHTIVSWPNPKQWVIVLQGCFTGLFHMYWGSHIIVPIYDCPTANGAILEGSINLCQATSKFNKARIMWNFVLFCINSNEICNESNLVFMTQRMSFLTKMSSLLQIINKPEGHWHCSWQRLVFCFSLHLSMAHNISKKMYSLQNSDIFVSEFYKITTADSQWEVDGNYFWHVNSLRTWKSFACKFTKQILPWTYLQLIRQKDRHDFVPGIWVCSSISPKTVIKLRLGQNEHQNTCSNSFSCMKIIVFWLQFHWNLFSMVQLRIYHDYTLRFNEVEGELYWFCLVRLSWWHPVVWSLQLMTSCCMNFAIIIQWIYFTIWKKEKKNGHYYNTILSLYISYQDITSRVC